MFDTKETSIKPEVYYSEAVEWINLKQEAEHEDLLIIWTIAAVTIVTDIALLIGVVGSTVAIVTLLVAVVTALLSVITTLLSVVTALLSVVTTLLMMV